MEKFSCTSRRSLILNTKILMFFLVSVAAQPGFLNIDCGGKSNSTDAVTNLSWITDTNYVDIGETANVSLSNVSHHLRSLRFFPKPLKKSCYRLPVKPNVTYLLRLWFLPGNYNGAQKLPSFNVSYETQGMLSQAIQLILYAEKIEWTSEKIFTSTNTVFYVCFIRTSGDSDPFVSAIQLRSLLSGMYAHKPRTMLSALARYDILAETSALTRWRYPQDPFDRFWKRDPFYIDEKNNVEYGRSEKMVANTSRNTNFPPPVVMQTAMIAKPNTGPLSFSLQRVDCKTFAVLYFAEVEVLNASESRKFKILINEKLVRNISFAEENYSIEVPIIYNHTEEQVIISLETIHEQGKSSRGPLINAFEYYRIVDSDPETDAHDLDVLLGIKRAFGFKFNHWLSDPCFGIEWDGIRCNKSRSVRVVEIDLSGRGLSGSLPNFCSLTKLQILRLQNNNFSGTVPDCLSQLNNLEELNLENNNFNGGIPKGLLQKRFLDLRYSGNPSLCKDKYQCHSKKKKARIVALSATGTVLAFLLVSFFVILYRRRSKLKKRNQMNNNQTLSIKVPNPISCRSFSLETIKTATQNFNQKIGQGGFGSVYFGKFQDRKDVAVKVLSASSKQGMAEFLNEIDLLSRVNHRGLVSLLGYCNVSKELMLVYEHMCGGSLKDHLYGSLADCSTLDWKTRLGVALDAAEGLEYLHVSCTPKIIHRDVKSSNILLDCNMRAKMADFGLSKIIGDDMASHVTTTIKGTVGYLDPEYFHTNKLTERSDVYSFGVVLLEIICGRKPIDPELSEEELSIVKWVLLRVAENEDSIDHLTDIIDKKLRMSDVEIKSFHHILNLSIKCIHSEALKRPSISEIVKQIKEAMDIIKSEEPVEPSYSAEYSYSLVGR